MKKRIIVSVSNDLVTDQRVSRSCDTLVGMGYDLLLAGRKLPHSPPLKKRRYSCIRMKLFFEKGSLFYISLQIRLFFLLLFKKADVLLSNDLDTLLPNVLVSQLKRIPLIYDSHEYFTGVPELKDRHIKRKLWKLTEKFCIRFITHAITVNKSIAALYEEEYGKEFIVIRNLPLSVRALEAPPGLPVLMPETPFVLLQGNGLNVDRGGEEAVMAMQYVEGIKLVVLGSGDVVPKLKTMVEDAKMQEKVLFVPPQSPDVLHFYTQQAVIGLSLDKPTSINQKLSLPNKLFDYIQSHLPVIATELPEVAEIVRKYDIGMIIPELSPETLAQTINKMIQEPERLAEYRRNCMVAAKELNWESEKIKFIGIFDAVFEENK